MTDKVINIFNKEPVETTVDQSEVNEVIDSVLEMRDSIQDIIIIISTNDDEMLIKSSNLTRETAYFLLGLAQLNALTQ
jgi:hypothetical protein